MAGIEVGKKAPAFSLPADSGSKVSLADYAGKRLVLYFYPKDDTPGCTTEAREFTAALKKFTKLNAVVLGVSKDTVEKHCKFRDKYGKKSMGIVRTTVVIDDKGVVRKIYPKVRVAGHVDKVLEELAELDD